ncbi:acyl-CoA dehydrogenase family protein [Micromonospora echinofusca]|uniref:Acyl-CoA dehydrogenase n=1 Tax=Micromonospora echinofusca TaxID=47858 RepID=A0ABS3VIS0_MICEH|nr:acyl-CoA dehydrogenase family protein [Micromonospora echinofusca]MBO4204430.1 acyl-CoA dehydrogenase [Micromonospora echinofusca]
MDFALSPTQRRLRSRIVEFARSSLGADAAGHDRDASFDRAGWDACARFGVLGWALPAEYGGSGFDPLTSIIAFEALAYGCPDNGLVFAVNNHVWACAIYIATQGTDEQKRQFLPGLIDGSVVGAHALTEPAVGSDALSITTTAVRRGDSYVLDGTKCFISNGPVADLFVVFARTDPDAAPHGRLSAFIVPASTPGVTVVRDIPKAGLRATPMGEIRFDRCEVPVRQRLGAEGAGYQIFTSAMEFERGFMFAAQVGSMERILDGAVAYAARRHQFGRPIADFQAVSHPIADMRVRLELARLLLYKVGWLKREGRMALLETAMLKLYASESLVDTALAAMQLHGARGYVADLPVERDVRDALASTIYGGTSEVQRNIIAGLVGLPSARER